MTVPGPSPSPTTSRRGLLVGLALGAPIVAYGVRGVFVDAPRTHPAELARWVVGSALAVDLLVIPAAAIVGAAVRRACPAAWWPTVRAALLVTGTLALVAWPFVRGYGQDPANPSLLPRDHAAGLGAAIAVVWAAAVAHLVIRTRRRRAMRHGHEASGGTPGGRY